MASIQLPPLSWNCHMHCFDPERHPFKSSRAYTPEPAGIDGLLQSAFTDHVMLVQATIEDGYGGLLENLARCRKSDPSKRVFGTIFWDPESEYHLQKLTSSDFDQLHDAGVRSVRIHGSYGGSGSDMNWVRNQFLNVAGHCPLRRHNWSISAQMPLAAWSSLTDLLDHPELGGIPIVADHNGSATPSDIGSPALGDFLHLLKSGRFYVKVGALHRRSPEDTKLMRPIVQAFVDTAPNAVLWGSDWPHCNASVPGTIPTPPLEHVDTEAELGALKAWLTEEQWTKMLVYNPQRVFGKGDMGRAGG